MSRPPVVRTFVLGCSLLLAACAHRPPAPAANPPARPCAFATRYDAVLWVQTAAEYRALAVGAYRAAARSLAEALADPAWTAALEQGGEAAGKPPAVILDLDETVLDNSPLPARLAIEGGGVSRELWASWGEHGRPEAIPGALEFLREAAGRGVAIFYVTNRDLEEEPVTLDTLRRLGLEPPPGEDRVLTRGERPEWDSDKASRRAFVAERYRVLLLVGDDLNDFVPAVGLTVAARAALVDRNADACGRRWIVLPNPFYGSWERATRPPARDAACEEVLQHKRSLLRAFESAGR